MQEHEKQMEELKSDVERLKEEKTIDISKVSHVAKFIKVVKHFFSEHAWSLLKYSLHELWHSNFKIFEPEVFITVNSHQKTSLTEY